MKLETYIAVQAVALLVIACLLVYATCQLQRTETRLSRVLRELARQTTDKRDGGSDE